MLRKMPIVASVAIRALIRSLVTIRPLRPREAADSETDQDPERRRNPVVADHHCGDDAGERERRADREVEHPSDQQDHHPHGHDPELGRVEQDRLDVQGGREGVGLRDDQEEREGADQQDEQERPRLEDEPGRAARPWTERRKPDCSSAVACSDPGSTRPTCCGEPFSTPL